MGRCQIGNEQLGLLGRTFDHGDDVTVDAHLLTGVRHSAVHQRRDEAPVVALLQQRSLLQVGVGHLRPVRVDHVDAGQHPLEHVVCRDELWAGLSMSVEHRHDGVDALLAVRGVALTTKPAADVVALRLDALMLDESEPLLTQALLEEGAERVHVAAVHVAVHQDGGDAGGWREIHMTPHD